MSVWPRHYLHHFVMLGMSSVDIERIKTKFDSTLRLGI